MEKHVLRTSIWKKVYDSKEHNKPRHDNENPIPIHCTTFCISRKKIHRAGFFAMREKERRETKLIIGKVSFTQIFHSLFFL